MSGFSAEIPMEVVKKILLKHYSIVDNYHFVWYNSENDTIQIGLEDDYKARNEANQLPSNTDCTHKTS